MIISKAMIRRSTQVLLVLIAIILLLLLINALHQCQSILSLPQSLPHPLLLPISRGHPLPELVPRPLSIWIVETSGRSQLTPREMCSVESAALHHPQSTIYLLLTSPILNSTLLMEMMTKYSNIQPRYLDLDTMFAGSPLSQLWLSGQVHRSRWPVSHLSDLVRYLVLYQYGGVYLDTDVILLRPLPPNNNFVSVEYQPVNHLAAGAIKFQPRHHVVKEILENLADKFSGSSWNANGPLVLEGAMRRLCESEGGGWWHGGGDKDGWVCGDVSIFREEYFYPVNWRAWETIFQSSYREEVLAAHRHSYAAHLWGHLSRQARVEWGSAGGQMARGNCPTAAQGFMWVHGDSEGNGQK